MPPEIIALIFGLIAALTWGVADFCGGLATKKSNVLIVMFFSQLLGAMLLSILIVITGETMPDFASLKWGLVAGMCSSLGLIFFYQGLAVGRMGIVAPISTLLAALIPVVFTLINVGLPGMSPLMGMALALVAIWLLSSTGAGQGVARMELGLSVLAGLCFGLYLVFMGRIGGEAILWPVISTKAAIIAVLAVVLLWRRQMVLPDRKRQPLIATIAVFDTAGSCAFLVAIHYGRLDISAILGAMSPASTVFLAWLILKEKLRHTQWLGVALTMVALALIAS